MVLVLSVLRCPDRSVPEERRVAGGEYTIGRGTECDWVLADADRVLSKKHCAVEYLSGGWQLRDLSTNGTFLNGAAQPIGRGAAQPLRDGDRLRLGAWEMECRISEERGVGAGAWESASAIPDPMAPRAPASDIFAAPLPGLGPAGGTPTGSAAILPADFDPFAPDDPGPVMPDHRPSTNDVFVPPRATMPDLLPADWAAPPAPQPAAADPFANLPDPFAGAPPAMAGKPAPIADPFADLAPPPAAPIPDPFADLAAPPRAPIPDPVAAPPPAARLPDPFTEAAPPAAMPARAAPPPAAPSLPDPFAEAPPPAPITAPAPSGDALTEALTILLRAAGLPPPAPGQDAARALEQAGQALAAAISGMRALLIARADVKREFRIEQTMLRAAGNNAVKFAATDEAALQALIAGRGDGAAAVREAVEDLTAHQLATVAATQAAARALLGKLSPDVVEQATPAGGFMPGAREKRMWEVYRRLHQEVVDQFDDDFDSAFGKAFARAYEQALRKGG